MFPEDLTPIEILSEFTPTPSEAMALPRAGTYISLKNGHLYQISTLNSDKRKPDRPHGLRGQ